MAQGYDADLGQLQAAVGTVRGALDAGTSGLTRAVAGSGACGDSRLAVALGEHTTAWTTGVATTTTDLQNAAASLGHTVLTYATADERAEAAVRRAGGGR